MIADMISIQAAIPKYLRLIEQVDDKQQKFVSHGSEGWQREIRQCGPQYETEKLLRNEKENRRYQRNCKY